MRKFRLHGFVVTFFVGSYSVMAPDVKAQVECGTEVIIDVELTEDLGPCSGPGSAITIRGPARLNLNGFSVTCDTDAPPSAGVELTGQGAELYDGVVKDCRPSVLLSGPGQHSVAGVLSTNNFQGAGFRVDEGSNKNRLIENAATNCDPGFDVRGEKSTLSYNPATGNDDCGFEVRGSRHMLRGNVSALNDVGGFCVEGSEHKLSRNVALGPLGYYVLGIGHQLDQNKAYGASGLGIENHAEYSTFSGNVSLGHDTDLVDLQLDCDGNLWTRNLFGTSKVYDGTGDQTCIE